MAAQEEAEFKNAETRKSGSETPKTETSVRREGDSSKSFDSPTYAERVSTQSQPQQQTRAGTRSNMGSPMWERKVSSDGSNAASSTPGRSRLRQVTLGDESPDDSTAVPVFGDWDDSNPASAEGYSHIFNKVREEKQVKVIIFMVKEPRLKRGAAAFHGAASDFWRAVGEGL